ncbi:MAG: SDR family oxidoreductase [Alphaproteobacteria bacterium]
MTNRLKNKIALVTGAARGIGQSIAESFVQEGAQVIITDIDDAPGKVLAKTLGKGTEYYHLDVSQESHWEALMKTLKEKFGRLDILVNNAGIIGFGGHFGPQNPEECALADWNAVHKINMDGTFLGCKYGIGLMKKHGGSIINMSSRSGVVGIPHAVAYASSKAAIRNHTKSVALYCAEKNYGIRCNSIHPAAILTPMWDAMLGTGPSRAKNLKNIERDIPLKRMGTPQEVAHLAVFLASDEAVYMTGAEFTIDGGILAGASAAPTTE